MDYPSGRKRCGLSHLRRSRPSGFFTSRRRGTHPSFTQTFQTFCRKYSGRIGRSSAAKALDTEAVSLSVIAHVRHVETNYDDLLAAMCDRSEARIMVRDAVAEILGKWQ